MTVKELYKWAVENGVENNRIEIVDGDRLCEDTIIKSDLRFDKSYVTIDVGENRMLF